MKKVLSILGALTAMASLTSCNLDDPKNITTFTFDVLNHISSDNPDEAVLLTPSSYTFRLDGNKNLLRFDTSNLLFDNVNHSFSTSDIRYTTQGFVVPPYQSGTIVSFDAGPNNVSDNGMLSVTDVKGVLNSTSYPAGALQSTPVLSYSISGKKVRTLRVDSYFTGQSQVAEEGVDPTVTDRGVYRLVINYQTKKAQLVMGFLPLRSLEEGQSLTLRDLPVTLTPEGYYIEQEEATAELSSNPGDHSWVFRDISFWTTDESLTRASISLTLAEEKPVTVEATVSYTLF